MKRALCLILICMVLLTFGGCQTESRETVFAMDTVMDLQLWGKGSADAVQKIKSLIDQLENTWSAQDAQSDLSAVNRGEEIADRSLLDKTEALCERTGGAFDPRLYAVTGLWGFGTEQACVPTQEEIDEARKTQLWDLGAAVKGYAGQQAADYLKTTDVTHGILNLGGNIQTYGNKPNGEPWSIGIQNPDGGDYLGLVSVVGTMSVVTSGDYQRFFEKDGVRYHHIIDPETGFPANSGLGSVTVICRDGLTADCLSTALFVMGLEEGAEFWRQSDDFEAVFITADGKLYATEGAALSGCEYEVIVREN